MSIYVDMERCIACHACIVACRQRHEGMSNISLQIIDERAAAPMLCHKCEIPACIAVCPSEASVRKDAVIAFHAEMCTGCELCLLACPFGVIWSDKLAHKCDSCSGDSACVATCPTQALLGNFQEAALRIRSRAAKTLQMRVRAEPFAFLAVRWIAISA
jgi:Fe-S-cluster-containing hydrogenase component 2